MKKKRKKETKSKNEKKPQELVGGFIEHTGRVGFVGVTCEVVTCEGVTVIFAVWVCEVVTSSEALERKRRRRSSRCEGVRLWLRRRLQKESGDDDHPMCGTRRRWCAKNNLQKANKREVRREKWEERWERRERRERERRKLRERRELRRELREFERWRGKKP